MDVVIKKATLDDLKTVQKLNLKLFEKEHKEYDSLLNMDRTFSVEGIKYYQDRISKEDSCVLIAIVNNKIVGYLCGGMSK
jgi:sulfite reductase alpha subunit-like flavoprotein